jgi:signal transduction histidine kinase/CheY-like chemotaxis protein
MKVSIFIRISTTAIVVATAAMLAALAFGIAAVPPVLPPWTAIAFLTAGVILWLEQFRPGRYAALAVIGSLAVLIIGLIVWGESGLNVDIGFDRLLFPRQLAQALRHPGRPAPLTGFHFCLLGVGLLLLRTTNRIAVALREFCALTAITLSYFAFLRYVPAPPVETGGAQHMSAASALMALVTACTILFLGAGGLLMPLLRDNGPAGLITRGLMPVPLILPPVTNGIRVILRNLGVYQGLEGATIFASTNILAALVILWIGGRKVLSLDLERRRAEDELRRSRDELDRRVHLRTRELTEAQAELQHTNAMLTSLIEACPLAICAFHPDGSLRQSNAAAEAMQLAENEACRKLAAEAGLGRPVTGVEVACLCDGKDVCLNVWASPIVTTDARLDGVVLMAADVTERKALEFEMQQTQKLESLGVLAGGLAHDFNNLLTGVLGNASLLHDALTDPQCLESVQAMLDAGQRMAKVTAQMLAYSGRGRFVVTAIDVSKQIEQITSLIRASIPKNVELRLSLAEGLAAIEGDPTQFQQVMMNLIINAAEAIGPEQGIVEVTTSMCEAREEELQASVTQRPVPPGTYVSIVVRDTGSGMDEQTRAKIFDPFFTTKFAGRGLGLSAVLGIVRTHRGAMLVNSQPGRGTTFRVLFPVCQPKTAEPETAPVNVSRGRGMVLVVDDEASVRQTAHAILRAAGYETVGATNGKDALALYATMPERIDVVLLDMTMPVLNGEETLERLLVRWPDAVVVATSGYDEAEAQQRLGESIAGFVQKPYTAAQLTVRIAEALDRTGNARRERQTNAG